MRPDCCSDYGSIDVRPFIARTSSGIGERPVMVMVRYECGQCGRRMDTELPEASLTPAEQSVRKRV